MKIKYVLYTDFQFKLDSIWIGYGGHAKSYFGSKVLIQWLILNISHIQIPVGLLVIRKPFCGKPILG